jgi:hypothetical protein
MGAAFFAVPELALDPAEAHAIAGAISEVNKYYKIPGIRPDHAAIASLIIVLSVTYGKRVPVILAKRKGVKSPSQVMQQPQEVNRIFPTDGTTAQPWFTGSTIN